MSGGGGEYSDENHLLNPTNSNNIDEDELEAQEGRSANINDRGGGGAFQDLLKHLDRGFSGRRHSFKRVDVRDHINHHQHHALLDNHNHLNHLNASDANDVLGDSAPPEWALLLIGCLLGLATGLFVAAFNKGVCSFFFFFLLLLLHVFS